MFKISFASNAKDFMTKSTLNKIVMYSPKLTYSKCSKIKL